MTAIRYPDDWFASSHTTANIDRNFAEWHRGRPRFAFWAIALDKPAVHRRVNTVQTRLSDWLLPGYERQPHVTLCVCGFPCRTRSTWDDYDLTCFESQILRLRKLAVKPFVIEIGGVNSFSSSPFLQIGVTRPSLAVIHRELSIDATADDRDQRFVPHLTLGLYRNAWPKACVERALTDCEWAETLVCHINRLSLMSYETHNIKGPLTVLAEFDLLTHHVAWKSDFVVD